MAVQENTWNVANRMHSNKDSDNPALNHIITGADEVYDDDKGKKQSQINAETDATLAQHTSTIQGLNSQNYETYAATDQTTAVTDVLPATGSVDTVYRLGNWDGSQFDETSYSEYSWNGRAYVHISTKPQIGEVFDISAYHASGGTLATYADLSAALDSNNGGGVPQSLQRGGMSVKYVDNSDNKYVQFRYMETDATTTATFTNVANWQGVDKELIAGSYNIVESNTIFNDKANISILNNKNIPFSHRYFAGASSGRIYYLDATTRLLLELPTENLSRIDVIDGNYRIEYAVLYNDIIPTSDFVTIITSNVSTIDVQSFLLQQQSSYNRIACIIRKTDNSNLESITNIDNIIKLSPVQNYNDVVNVNQFANVSYFESKTDARNAITENIRQSGLAITYRLKTSRSTTYYSWITEQFIGTDLAGWSNDINWQYYGSISPKYAFFSKNVQVVDKFTLFFPSGTGVFYNLYNIEGGVFNRFVSVSEDTTFNLTAENNSSTAENNSSRYLVIRNNELILVRTAYDEALEHNDIVLIVSSNNEILGGLAFDSYNQIKPTATKRFTTMLGVLSENTGLYPTSLQYYIGYSHTPAFIKARLGHTIVTRGLTGYISFYDINQNYLGNSARIPFDTTDSNFRIIPPSSAYYYRLGIHQEVNYVDIKGNFDSEYYSYQNRPANGYQPFTFEVLTDYCNREQLQSALQKQYERTTDSGMLHLPSNYSVNGKPTPMIIYIHGAANNYSTTSTGFDTTCPLAPEWDAAGYAQMDLDLIPDEYNDLKNNAEGGSSDDAECIFAAYKWCIEHFNIRRDGVYLFGRSRGGQAVLQALGKYNPNVMPIICAINNAGANQIINYGISGGTSLAQWNLICESFNLPTEGRPTPDGTHTFLAQDSTYNFLAANIKQWWRKATICLSMLVENKSDLQTPEQILQFMHLHPRVSGVDDPDFLTFLEKLRYKSPVPLRFDWCAADTIQPWEANNGRGNYSKVNVDGFLNNLAGHAEYRRWPTVDQTTPAVSGATDRGHWHELFNIDSNNYIMPDGTVITTPSMARLEWLLWAQSHDNREL